MNKREESSKMTNEYFLSHGSHATPQQGRCAMESLCEEWTGRRNDKGYGYVGDRRAHRVAWERAHGPIPAGLCVLHRCDNPPCVNVEHLFLGTQAENIADRHAKGRDNGARPGEDHFAAKLTNTQVLEMRARYSAGGVTQRQLADEYGVSRGNVSKIVNRRTYASAAA